MNDIQTVISASLLRLQMKSPFFATLALFARFIPFFEQVEERWDRQAQAVCVYLTDGYGIFPDQAPELPVLWVVTPGGLTLEEFPFGESVRLWS